MATLRRHQLACEIAAQRLRDHAPALRCSLEPHQVVEREDVHREPVPVGRASEIEVRFSRDLEVRS